MEWYKHHMLYASIVAGCIVIGVALVLYLNAGTDGTSRGVLSSSEQNAQYAVLRLGEATLTAEVAVTPEERHTGLSGRTHLADGNGMLFVFPTDERHGFWMPDMHFSIDIIWFNTEMRVVHIAEQVAPDSYPTIYTPDEPARYVLEVPAGWVMEHDIAEGDTLVLDR